MKLLRYSLCVPALIATAHATQYLTVQDAQRLFFPAADEFAEEKFGLTPEQTRKVERQARAKMRLKRYRIWQALTRGKPTGTLILDEVYGKHEFITYAVALDISGAVLGVEILEYRESYGGEIRNRNWRDQFVGKRATDRLELDKDIRNISGATLSCQHVTEGIRRILAIYDVALKPQ
jgi:Na+-transporting NADH:ubiquinone oxidoreductase subunit C